ncbi:MAG: hypothetical protein V8Q57_10380 [Blautia sp.]
MSVEDWLKTVTNVRGGEKSSAEQKELVHFGVITQICHGSFLSGKKRWFLYFSV